MPGFTMDRAPKNRFSYSTPLLSSRLSWQNSSRKPKKPASSPVPVAKDAPIRKIVGSIARSLRKRRAGTTVLHAATYSFWIRQAKAKFGSQGLKFKSEHGEQLAQLLSSKEFRPYFLRIGRSRVGAHEIETRASECNRAIMLIEALSHTSKKGGTWHHGSHYSPGYISNILKRKHGLNITREEVALALDHFANNRHQYLGLAQPAKATKKARRPASKNGEH